VDSVPARCPATAARRAVGSHAPWGLASPEHTSCVSPPAFDPGPRPRWSAAGPPERNLERLVIRTVAARDPQVGTWWDTTPAPAGSRPEVLGPFRRRGSRHMHCTPSPGEASVRENQRSLDRVEREQSRGSLDDARSQLLRTAGTTAGARDTGGPGARRADEGAARQSSASWRALDDRERWEMRKLRRKHSLPRPRAMPATPPLPDLPSHPRVRTWPTGRAEHN
jgi:hypothetical protein